MFLTIKKKSLLIFLCAVICLISCGVYFGFKNTFASTYSGLVVVIDAGHGGADGGSVSSFSGIDENHINLEYAKCLEDIFESIGVRVIMTRKDLNGLYPIYSTNRKKDDMKQRAKIIKKSNADLVLSIHMNSFPLESSRGAQVFFKDGDISSQTLANNIQQMFVQNLPKARTNAQKGDYYILNCSNTPSVIVECGFLSNKEEESLLITKSYMQKVCLCIAYGVILSFIWN